MIGSFAVSRRCRFLRSTAPMLICALVSSGLRLERTGGGASQRRRSRGFVVNFGEGGHGSDVREGSQNPGDLWVVHAPVRVEAAEQTALEPDEFVHVPFGAGD